MQYKAVYLLFWKFTAQKIWPVPEAVVTVLCTPDDGCGWHPKHVEWTCRIINRLLCVASRWTIININTVYIFITYIFRIHFKTAHVTIPTLQPKLMFLSCVVNEVWSKFLIHLLQRYNFIGAYVFIGYWMASYHLRFYTESAIVKWIRHIITYILNWAWYWKMEQCLSKMSAYVLQNGQTAGSC